MEKILRWLNLGLILVTLTSYLSPFIDPASFWLFSILGMGYPWLLLFNMLFALWWIFIKNWYFLFSIGCILVGWNHFQSFIGLNRALPKQKEAFTVMTFNSMGFQKLKGQTKKEFFKMLENKNPTIICVQEAFTSYRPISKKKSYPYIYSPKNKQLLIYSKLPFINKGNIDISNQANGCIFVDVKVKNKIIRVYNFHLQSNMVSNDASKLKKEGNLQEKKTWLGIKGMLGKVKRAGAVRSRQAKIIIEHIEKSKYPVMVCGDMNDTPLSYNYHLFSKNLNDGFKERATGIGTTYNGTIPALRIDYILTGSKFQVNSHQIIKQNFSDHYPVLSNINLVD